MSVHSKGHRVYSQNAFHYFDLECQKGQETCLRSSSLEVLEFGLKCVFKPSCTASNLQLVFDIV